MGASPAGLEAFTANFPWFTFVLFVALFFFARAGRTTKALFFLSGIFLSARYLGWRIFRTLNFVEPLGPVVSVALLLAEAYCFVTIVLLVVQMGLGGQKPKRRAIPSGQRYWTVDVFIPVLREPLHILEKTLIGATGIRYMSKRVYVLDDGHREAVRELAGRYGVGYLPGPRKQSKAENLNSALKQTAGDLIAVFDTDHIPLVSFLNETVPFFSNPRVGFVQTPHRFYNADIFQRAFGAPPSVPSEEDIYHHAIQAARDGWNSAFFTGSGAVIRRAALDDIGGFPVMSVTEDIHASQKMHAAGWTSCFVDKDLMVGLQAENLASYLVQRRRWMVGTLQIFFRDNPLFCRGLHWRQRLGYFSSLFYFFFPLVRCVLWATPLFYLFFHIHPVIAEVGPLLGYLIPFLVAPLLITSVALPGWPRMLWAELSEAAIAVPLLRSMPSVFLPRRIAFHSTPKGVTAFDRRFDWGSAKLTALAAVVTLAAVVKGGVEFARDNQESAAHVLNLAWAGIGLFYLGVSLLVAWEKHQRREQVRVRAPVAFRLRSRDEVVSGKTFDLGLSGFSFLTDTARPMSEVARVVLKLDKEVAATAHLVYFDRIAHGTYRCAYAFRDLDEKAARDIVRHVFASPRVWSEQHEPRVRHNATMARVLLRGLLYCFRPSKARQRKHPRTPVLQRRRLYLGGIEKQILVTNRSAGGISALMFRHIPENIDGSSIRNGRMEPGLFKKVYSRRVAPFVWSVGLQQTDRSSVPLR